MQMQQFLYNLPEDKIAKYPPKERGTTKLLILNRKTGNIEHKKYYNIVDYIEEGDVIVLNQTKVEKRRTYFISNKDRIHEVLFLNKENTNDNNNQWYCLIKGSKHIKEKEILTSQEDNNIQIQIIKKQDKGCIVEIISKQTPEEIFNKIGHTPIPPYMHRKDTKEDYVRYNTVFSKIQGSVAAPTASLNLTEDILTQIKNKGAKIAYIELQVGWGTFAPITEKNIEDHKIHEEQITISKESADIINNAIKNNKNIWAFGTTVARTLESCAYDKDNKSYVKEYKGSTKLYIYPSYKWKIANHLITNFHMPDSSLILLVSSFAGTNLIKKAYKEALDNNYMFLSYGDSMLIV